MAILGSLVVRVMSDMRGFVTGMRQGRREHGQFVKQIQGSVGQLAGFTKALTGLGAIGGAAGFGVILNSQRQLIDSTAKVSDKLGIQTEALIGLRHAAELTGVASGTLDMALQRFTRRLNEAAHGSGEAKGAIAELGLDAKQLSQLPLEQALGMVADRLNRLDTQAEKVRIAFKLFDSEGVALVNTLAQGSDGLARIQKEAQELGLTFSRDAAAGVEAFNAALDRLTKGVKSFGGKIVLELSDDATALVELLSGRGFRGTKGEGLKGGAAGPLADLSIGGMIAGTRNAVREGLGRLWSPTELPGLRPDANGRVGFQPMIGPGRGREAMISGPTKAAAFSPLTDAIGKKLGRLVTGAGDLGGQAVEQGSVLAALGLKQLGNLESKMRDITSDAIFRQNEARNLERLKKPGGRQGINAAIEADTNEGFTALRANLNKSKSLEKINEEQLAELKTLNGNIDKILAGSDDVMLFEIPAA